LDSHGNPSTPVVRLDFMIPPMTMVSPSLTNSSVRASLVESDGTPWKMESISFLVIRISMDTRLSGVTWGVTSSIGFVFDKVGGTPFLLNARLNALETNGEGKIISSPKIVTLDNKKAKIKQGIEWPYLERDDSGGSSVMMI